MPIPTVLRVALLALLLPAVATAQDAPVVTAGTARITLSGRVQAQYTTTTVEEEPVGDWGLRRVRLEARVVVNELVSGRIQPDFAGDRFTLKDAYLSLHPADGVEILAGQAHRPFSTLTRYSSLRMAPIERGLRIRGVDGWDEQAVLMDLDYTDRDVGLQLFLAPDSAPLGFDAALALLDGPLAGEVVGRHTWQLVSSVGIAPLPHLGLRAAWSRRHFLLPDPSSAPADESDLTAGDALLASVVWDPPAGFFAAGEVTTGDFDPAADVRFDAAQLWGGYRIPLPGRLTMLEPIARISHASVSDPDVQDGILLTGGVNLYLGGLNRLMLDYEAWRPDAGADDARSLKVMFQLAF